MNKRYLGLILAALCLLHLAGPGAAVNAEAARRQSAPSGKQEEKKPPRPENFAHRITLTGDSGSLLTLVVPEDVYLGMRRPDQRDICVFDSQGLPAPFALNSPERESVTRESNVILKFFPWHPEAASGASDGAEGKSAPVAGDIEINSHGNIIRIKGQGGPAMTAEGAPRPGQASSPAYYLLDMDEYLQVIAAWSAGRGFDLLRASLIIETKYEGDYACQVTMQTSGNLDDWQSIGKRQTLTRVRHGENVLARESLSVPPGALRYLLLKLEGEAIAPEKISVTMNFGHYTSVVSQRAVSGALAENRRSVVYDLGGHFSLSELDFQLPESEIINVRLSSSNNPAQGWRFQGTHLLYRMNGDGDSVGSEPIRLSSRDRYWRLDARGDFPFAQAPVLKAAWYPAQLSFLARGQGPWILAFGGDDAVEPSPMPASGLAGAKEAVVISAPAVEPEKQPESAPVTPEEKEQWMLWGVLILGVLVLLGIAFWLARSMRKK